MIWESACGLIFIVRISIHKKLFTGIYRHAGSLRDYNITKKEWVLDGATVLYGSASELRTTLEYDFSEDKTIAHIMALYDKYGTSEMFNRKDVETVTGLKATRAYEIIKLLLNNGIIRLVKGHGKGKYSFK